MRTFEILRHDDTIQLLHITIEVYSHPNTRRLQKCPVFNA